MTLLTISVNYQNKPVRNLDLKYYLGSDWPVPTGVSQGKALLEFMCKLNELPDILKINVMYNDMYKAAHNGDLRKVLEEMNCPAFRESRFEIPIKNVAKSKQKNPTIKLISVNNSVLIKQYLPLANKIIKAILTKNTKPILNNMTPKGKKNFGKIIVYGNAKILEDNSNIYANKINGKIYLRGLPVQFDFPNSGRKFNEQLVFVINENNKLEKINFALSNDAKKDILGKLVASDTEKFLITNFIEEYKTAYCTKNIDFLEKVFDNNALIIVGQMLKESEKNIDGMYKKLGKNWRPIRYSKKQYLRNLKNVFAGNEYINLHFEDNKVTRVNSDSTKIFGIQIHQYYFSQRYSDEGYLFLMFDLTDPKNPKIYVRTWQPEENPD